MENSVQQKMFEGISDWQQSGLTQKAWCEQNNIAYATFHYWYKRYRIQKQADQGSSSGSFVRLLLNRPATGCWCELELPGGSKLFFHQPVSAAFIRSLLD